MALRVERVVCGSLMTSLEMAGVSLSLLKMESGWEQYIGTYIRTYSYTRWSLVGNSTYVGTHTRWGLAGYI